MKYGRLDRNIIVKFKEDLKNEGFKFTFIKTCRFFYHKTLPYFAPIIVKYKKKNHEFFKFKGIEYPYHVHSYNLTWINERTVEIPIALEYLGEYMSKHKSVLEIGFVLPNYIKSLDKWDVVDKFDKGEDVINQDILDYNPKKRYDLILSVSTFEHIGYDDEDNPEKVFKVIDKCVSMLKPDGKLIFTIPLGYNKRLDNYVFMLNNNTSFMKRLNNKNHWIEASKEEVINSRYNHPYNNANAIAIVTITK